MPNRLTLSELSHLLSRRELSAREATEACLEAIRRRDPVVHAFLHVDKAGALAQADAADAARRRGNTAETHPLLGVPLAIKDVIAVRNQPLTCGSRILAQYIAPYDATVTAALRRAGAVFLGRLNMDEFAMGSSTENSAFGPTRNPWDTSRIPGGSSGGSAAAVAADECSAALGSDTGGSVRLPAAFCGVVGLKPTYGRVSRYGLVAYASSLDQIGLLTKTVRDAALLLEAVAGHDPLDSTSVPQPVPPYAAGLDKSVAGLRVGLPREYFVEGGLDADVRRSVEQAVAQLESLGVQTVQVSLDRKSVV